MQLTADFASKQAKRALDRNKLPRHEVGPSARSRRGMPIKLSLPDMTMEQASMARETLVAAAKLTGTNVESWVIARYNNEYNVKLALSVDGQHIVSRLTTKDGTVKVRRLKRNATKRYSKRKPTDKEPRKVLGVHVKFNFDNDEKLHARVLCESARGTPLIENDDGDWVPASSRRVTVNHRRGSLSLAHSSRYEHHIANLEWATAAENNRHKDKLLKRWVAARDKSSKKAKRNATTQAGSKKCTTRNDQVSEVQDVMDSEDEKGPRQAIFAIEGENDAMLTMQPLRAPQRPTMTRAQAHVIHEANLVEIRRLMGTNFWDIVDYCQFPTLTQYGILPFWDAYMAYWKMRKEFIRAQALHQRQMEQIAALLPTPAPAYPEARPLFSA